jgi:hypothetical protein
MPMSEGTFFWKGKMIVFILIKKKIPLRNFSVFFFKKNVFCYSFHFSYFSFNANFWTLHRHCSPNAIDLIAVLFHFHILRLLCPKMLSEAPIDVVCCE